MIKTLFILFLLPFVVKSVPEKCDGKYCNKSSGKCHCLKKIKFPTVINTDQNYWYRQAPLSGTGRETFKVKAKNDAHLLLCPDVDQILALQNDNIGLTSIAQSSARKCFEIVIGGWYNQASVIRRGALQAHEV